MMPDVRTAQRNESGTTMGRKHGWSIADDEHFVVLLTSAVHDAAEGLGLSESMVKSVIYRMVQAGQIQERRAPFARAELAETLGPSLADYDPVPQATIAQAIRLAKLRTSLLREGAFPTSSIAEGRGMTPSAARTWISRHKKAFRIFTVSQEGETLVPAFLLDASLEPRENYRPAIEALRSVGEDGWALWAWFVSPSSWLGGKVPSELVQSDPGRVAQAAIQRASSAA